MPRDNSIPIEISHIQANRFWSNVSGISASDGCWLWSGRVDGFGYGHFKSKGHSLKAHRVAWTLKHGPIPSGMTLDHLCRNPRCVKPDHLQVVTNKENILRGTSPIAVNAAKDRCRKHDCEYVIESTPSRVGRRKCPRCIEEKWRRRNARLRGAATR